METVKVLIQVAATLLLASGFVILILTFAAPAVLESRLMRWFVTGPHPAPTKADQRVMAGVAIFSGLVILLNTLLLFPYAMLAVVPLWVLALVFRARLARARA
jgi:hypothetical protein